MRLHSYLKNNANLTRSELMKLRNENRILVNGETTDLLYEVGFSDVITIDGKEITEQRKVYYLYNKPIGIECTNSDRKPNNLKSLNLSSRVFSLGRLDKDSHGLLILTNDGKLSDKLMNANSHVEKEYIVKTKYDIDEVFLDKMANGVMIDGKMTKNAKISKINDKCFDIIICEGRNRQIRKMTKACANYVIDLERIRIGKVMLGDLKLGEIKEVEINELID